MSRLFILCCTSGSKLVFATFLFLALLTQGFVKANIHQKVSHKLSKKQEPLPACQACKALVKSFLNGMEQTTRGKYDGGDSHWEENRLGNYADSELRLVEIQEKLCSDLERSQDQCHTYAEEHEAELEEWWFKERKNSTDLHTFLCIDRLKVCCPKNHYGPNCMPCMPDAENPCGGHGKCKGSGTRKGSGQCICNSGYTGELCHICDKGYFLNISALSPEKSEDTWECSKCHASCKGHCREAGPRGCEVCADGYQHDPDFGCLDIDECLESAVSPCRGNTFCANSQGSYICMDCDPSCKGCTGDGPDMCILCADTHYLKEGFCLETSQWRKALHVEVARYATYFGLFLASLIVARRSNRLGYLVGAAVAAYVAISEYALGQWGTRVSSPAIQSFLSKVF